VRRPRAGDETYPPHPGGAGARANKFTQFAQTQTAVAAGTMTRREELADGVSPVGSGRKRGPAPEDAAMARREAPHLR
jgi:hypothetical protein